MNQNERNENPNKPRPDSRPPVSQNHPPRRPGAQNPPPHVPRPQEGRPPSDQRQQPRGVAQRPPARAAQVPTARPQERRPMNSAVAVEPKVSLLAHWGRKLLGSTDYIRPADIVRTKGGVDRPMLIIIILLTAIGSILIFTSSYATALSRWGDSFHYIRPQVAWVALGMAAMVGIMHIDYRLMRKFAVHFFVLCVILLIATLFVGGARGLAQRWLTIPLGFMTITFQPSELMKLGIAMILARYYHKNAVKVVSKNSIIIFGRIKIKEASVYGVFLPAIIVGAVCALIMAQNHFSGTIIMFLIGAFIIWASGAQKFWLISSSVAALVGVIMTIMTVPYARTRITTWLNPENYSITNELWQITQGLLAIGSGGFFGVGLGNSRQKHMFIPEPQNDFIFTVAAEELGFVGAVGILALYLVFIWRGYKIAQNAPDIFSKLLAFGIVSKVGIQTILNIAVVTGSIPNTGISLPFASYGGTALVMLLAEMGILLSISRYSYQQK